MDFFALWFLFLHLALAGFSCCSDNAPTQWCFPTCHLLVFFLEGQKIRSWRWQHEKFSNLQDAEYNGLLLVWIWLLVPPGSVVLLFVIWWELNAASAAPQMEELKCQLASCHQQLLDSNKHKQELELQLRTALEREQDVRTGYISPVSRHATVVALQAGSCVNPSVKPSGSSFLAVD